MSSSSSKHQPKSVTIRKGEIAKEFIKPGHWPARAHTEVKRLEAVPAIERSEELIKQVVDAVHKEMCAAYSAFNNPSAKRSTIATATILRMWHVNVLGNATLPVGSRIGDVKELVFRKWLKAKDGDRLIRNISKVYELASYSVPNSMHNLRACQEARDAKAVLEEEKKSSFIKKLRVTKTTGSASAASTTKPSRTAIVNGGGGKEGQTGRHEQLGPGEYYLSNGQKLSLRLRPEQLAHVLNGKPAGGAALKRKAEAMD